MAFTWLSGSNVAGAAGTTAAPAAAQTAAADDGPRDGHDCPNEGQGSGSADGSGSAQQAAPSGSTSGSELSRARARRPGRPRAACCPCMRIPEPRYYLVAEGRRERTTHARTR